MPCLQDKCFVCVSQVHNFFSLSYRSFLVLSHLDPPIIPFDILTDKQCLIFTGRHLEDDYTLRSQPLVTLFSTTTTTQSSGLVFLQRHANLYQVPPFSSLSTKSSPLLASSSLHLASVTYCLGGGILVLYFHSSDIPDYISLLLL